MGVEVSLGNWEKEPASLVSRAWWMGGILLSEHPGDPETKKRFCSWHGGVHLEAEMLLGGGWRL